MNVEFNSIGLFTTTEKWIHPHRCEITTEIIYVTDGEVYLYEEDAEYCLKKGDMIILRPYIRHGGYRESISKTSFYWLHITGEMPNELYGVRQGFMGAGLFRELIDYAYRVNKNENAIKTVTNHIMLNIEETRNYENKSKLSGEVYEWVRINADARLNVCKVAEYFGYNPEHISRIVKLEHGVGLKRLIDRFIIEKAKNLLANTTYSVKEIAFALGFKERTAFINFFKYHEKMSPTAYKNSHTEIHMNKS